MNRGQFEYLVQISMWLAIGCINLILAFVYGLDFVGILIGCLFIQIGGLISLEYFLKNKKNSPLGETSISWYISGFILFSLGGTYFVFNIAIGVYYPPVHQVLFPFSLYGLALGNALIGFLKRFFVSQDPEKLLKKRRRVKLEKWVLAILNLLLISFFLGYVGSTFIRLANVPVGLVFIGLFFILLIIPIVLMFYCLWMDILRGLKKSKT